MPANDPVLTVAEMQAAEQALIDAGTSVDTLMQRAGRGAAEWVWRIAAGRAVTVLCGPGNNGGDGYVIAEVLRERGLDVLVVAPIEPKTGAARNARALYRGVVAATGEGRRGAVLVDCLFGSGLTRPLSSELLECLVELAAHHHHHRVAIDLPSGVDSDSGALLNDDLPRIDLTVALGAWKFAHWTMPASGRMGLRRLVDIGVRAPRAGASLSERPCFEPPAADAHKYRRGLLAIVGGAMPGAALLACRAAMHSGAGYVKLLSNAPPAASPALVVDERPLTESLDDARIGALLVGPGLGRDEEAKTRLDAALASGAPLVLDADALILLGRRTFAQDVLLTPHEGELARLCDTYGIARADKLAMARGLAKASGATVLAKGPDTVLCAPGGTTCLFPPGPTWLSTAGTGDVLAGMAASRMATGASAFEAAEQAVWLHHEAAHVAGAAFTAEELAQAVKTAYARFL